MKHNIITGVLVLCMLFFMSAYSPFRFLNGGNLHIVTKTGNDISFNIPKAIDSGTYNRVTVDSFGRARAGAIDSAYTVTRAFNSNYTISATRAASVVYSISIIGNDSAYASLEVSSNGGGLWTPVCAYGCDFTNATSRTSGIIMGRVPANNLVRIRTHGIGAGNITYLLGQETLL